MNRLDEEESDQKKRHSDNYVMVQERPPADMISFSSY